MNFWENINGKDQMNNKIALIGDTHFGIKKGVDWFFNSQLNFLKDEFIPYLKKSGIKNIVFLGDIFDNRIAVDVKIQNIIFDFFKNDLKDFNVFIILGNHDIYLNSSLKYFSLKYLSLLKNINIIDKIQTIKICDVNLLAVPWQVNKKDFNNYISNNVIDSKVLLGHFAIKGFKFNKHVINTDGFDNEIFYNNFDLTFSGHFHTRSKQKKSNNEIIFIGSSYQLTRNDIDEEKGFCVLDINTLKYEYVNNNTSVKYIDITYPQTISSELIKNNIIDINIEYTDDCNESKIQKYIKKVESYEPIQTQLKIKNNLLNEVINDCDIKNSYDLMYEYVKKQNFKDESNIYKILEMLYEEAKE